jgi:hypothetical protein
MSGVFGGADAGRVATVPDGGVDVDDGVLLMRRAPPLW